MEHEAFRLIGEPKFGGILVVSDHASNRVPDDIELGIASHLLNEHIAIDIGVGAVAELLAQRPGIAAYLGNVSRLVCDLNRAADEPSVFPVTSDGHAIPGNALDLAGRTARLARFHAPYHETLAALLDRVPQALLLSLHSFTPQLASNPEEKRPWHVGVLYNADDRAARLAIPLLQAEGLCVGDQEPYSGKDLNESMDRHGEAEGRPYLGVEVRQDLISTPAGQTEWAERLGRIANQVAIALAG
ncbi:N-formylglutamate amidohydrolase [Novosphingobium sp. FKTRR1]|uniref:N-formylglutamate amidohydrolase n=1 Tax=Novosphingobium sp. FKTRR1 TaxID=2879118 RepID=UPI001CF09CF9|nr:N-formylglutamate amidohydrolase [Novosphingobium sp. FKTRR1]